MSSLSTWPRESSTWRSALPFPSSSSRGSWQRATCSCASSPCRPSSGGCADELGGTRSRAVRHPEAHGQEGRLRAAAHRLVLARPALEVVRLRRRARRLGAEGRQPGAVPPRLARRRFHALAGVRCAHRAAPVRGLPQQGRRLQLRDRPLGPCVHRHGRHRRHDALLPVHGPSVRGRRLGLCGPDRSLRRRGRVLLGARLRVGRDLRGLGAAQLARDHARVLPGDDRRRGPVLELGRPLRLRERAHRALPRVVLLRDRPLDGVADLGARRALVRVRPPLGRPALGAARLRRGLERGTRARPSRHLRGRRRHRLGKAAHRRE